MCYSWWNIYTSWPSKFFESAPQWRPLCRGCESCENYCWTVALTNSVHLSDCTLICILFWNKVFKAAVIAVADLSFMGTLQAYRDYMSLTFNWYLFLLLNFERELKTARSISQTSTIFVTIDGFLGKLFLTSLYKVYVSWPDNHSSTVFYYIYRPLPTLQLNQTLLCV